MREIKAQCNIRGLRAIEEFYTEDRARIDLVILGKDEEKILAIEFENSYKWIRQRVLYNALKAHRAGFKRLILIYPFKSDPLKNSWVRDFIESELKMEVSLVKPEKVVELIEGYLIKK